MSARKSFVIFVFDFLIHTQCHKAIRDSFAKKIAHKQTIGMTCIIVEDKVTLAPDTEG